MPESSRDEIAKLEALYANNPGGRVFTHLAEAYRKAGELDRARAILEEGLAKHAGYASAHVVLGRVLMGLEQDDEAVATFRRVLELDPHNLIALRSLGDLSRAAGRNDEALRYFEDLRHLDPSSEGIADVIAELQAAPARTFEPPQTDQDETQEEQPAWQPDPMSEQPDTRDAQPEPAGETEFAIEHGYGAETDPAPIGEAEPAYGAETSQFIEPEVPTSSFEPETEAETEYAPETALSEPEPAEAPDMFAQHIDLDWVPSNDEDEEGLPGDLAELAGFSAPPPGLDEPQVPTFALPETDDFSFLSEAEEEQPEGPVFDDVTLDVPADTTDEDQEVFEGAIELNAFESEPDEDSTAGVPAFEAPAFEAPASEAPPLEEPPVFEEPTVAAASSPFEDEPAEEESAGWTSPVEDESGELVTETIAELYRSQGLHDRAADVYRTLLLERPGDADLEAKLYEAQSLARGEVPQHEAAHRPAADPFEYEEPPFESTAPEAIEPELPDPAEAWLAGAAGTAVSAPTPYAWTEVAQDQNADAEAPITEYFRSLLSWRPAASTAVPEAPAASEAPAAPAAAAPAPVPDAAYEPEPAFSGPGFDPDAEDEIVFSDAPAAEEEDVLLLLEQTQPPEESREVPPLTAATVVEPDAMPWEEPAAPEAGEAIAAEAQPAVSNATNSEDAFDEWFGPAGEGAGAPQAPEPAADPGELEGEDDDDLEMFRSWLQSLKK
jgi:tetratricopeptide (TPR) repeat protein